MPSKITSNISTQPLQKPMQMPPTILTNPKGPSMTRLYQTCTKEPASADSATGSVGPAGQPTAPRMTQHKSPGKTFKHSGRNTMSA